MDNVDVNDRVRAWVLTQVDGNRQVIAEQINELDNTKSPDLVIIRKDLVSAWEGSPFNLVVPIDAADLNELENAVDKIKGMMAGTRVEVLQVIDHDPKNPWG
jgi:hypothetical protein